MFRELYHRGEESPESDVSCYDENKPSGERILLEDWTMSDSNTDNVRSIERTKEQISEKVAKTRDAVEEGLGVARERFQQAAEGVGERLQDVPAAAQKASEEMRRRTERAREAAREKYAVASEQLRDNYDRVRHDVESSVTDAEDYVRSNPGKAILISAGIGFLIGLAFRRRDYD